MLNKQKGFSLIETMVAMALLAGAVLFGMNALDEQNKSRVVRTKQTMHRFIAIQVTQHINANIPFYPPVDTGPSDKIIYVGCMTKDGVLQGNKFIFKLASSFDEAVSTALCDATLTAYEVRFFWSDPDKDEVKINILTMSPGTSQSLAVHNFKIFAK